MLRFADPVEFVREPWSPAAAKVKLAVVAATEGGRLLIIVVVNRVRDTAAAIISFLRLDNFVTEVSCG